MHGNCFPIEGKSIFFTQLYFMEVRNTQSAFRSPCPSAWQQLKPCKSINLLVISSQFDYLTIAHHSNAQVKISIGWGLSCLKWLVHVLSTRQPLSFYCSKQILLYIFYYYLLCIKVYFGKLNFYPIHLKDEGILICILSYT